jgi:polyketide cyclase/dehydrase/lipid transport protein
MWTNEVSIDIEVPPAEAFAYLADFPRHREWSSAKMGQLRQLTPGPIGVGTEFEASETVPAKVVTYSRITALDANRRIAWHSWFRKLTAVDWEFALGETAAGTRLVQRSSWQAGNPVMALYLRLVRYRRIPVENRQSLERIKAALERAQVRA